MQLYLTRVLSRRYALNLPLYGSVEYLIGTVSSSLRFVLIVNFVVAANEYSINVTYTWMPPYSNMVEPFCFTVYDGDGQAADPRCIYLRSMTKGFRGSTFVKQ